MGGGIKGYFWMIQNPWAPGPVFSILSLAYTQVDMIKINAKYLRNVLDLVPLPIYFVSLLFS